VNDEHSAARHEHCAARSLGRRRSATDPYKLPKAIIIVDELPKTSTGKIQKNLLRDGSAAYYAEH
jgi:acyl-coenzyme A synthetase/AMP-(fatty) acid ligase